MFESEDITDPSDTQIPEPSTESIAMRPTRIRNRPQRYSDFAYSMNEDYSDIPDLIVDESNNEDTYVHHETNAVLKGNYSLRSAARKDPSQAEEASFKEFQTLLDKDTFCPIQRRDLNSDQKSKIICGFTFLKEKFHIDGSLDKWKARFVAGGRMVDSTLLGPLHSSTV